MAERVDAPAVDVGDRAGGAEGQVAADQADADRVAGRQRGGDGRPGGDRGLGRVPRRERRAERTRERRGHVAGEAGHRVGDRDRPQLRMIRERGEHRRVDAGQLDRRAGAGDPREGVAQGGRELRRRRRPGQVGGHAPHRRRRAGGAVGGVDHVGDRGDAGDRLLREGAERVGHRADEPAVDVDGAAAHPLHDARVGQALPGQPGQDQVAPRPDRVGQRPEDLDLEFGPRVALEDADPGAVHPGLDLVHGHEPLGAAEPRRGQRAEQRRDEARSGQQADRSWRSDAKGSAQVDVQSIALRAGKPPNRVDRLPLSLLSSPAMDRLHVPGATQAASAAVAGVGVSFGPAIPFGPSLSFGNRVWWYDVHQVEGAV